MIFRQRRRRLGVESLENRMVLSGLGLTMKGIELPIDGTPAAEKVCVAKNAGNVQAAKGAAASDTVVKPFKVSGGGTADFLPLVPGTFSPFNATGTATNLGKYTGEGSLQVDAANNTFSSYEPFVFVGANGDELHFTFEGVVELEPITATTFRSTWTATFTPVIGENTGKFANVVGGSLTMIAQTGEFELTDPDIPYTWKGTGELEYGKSVPYKGSGIGTYLPSDQTYSGSGNATHLASIASPALWN